MMRSRSSRLFIVLLHLVGVSTNLPRNIWGNPYWQGIVGVHPMAILLESLELESAGGLDGLLRELRSAGYSVDDVLSEPYWLQDDSDGKCFGPGGFSECGDATLWFVRKRPRRRSSSAKDKEAANGRRAGLFSLFSWRGGDDEETWDYALELVDGNLLTPASRPATSEGKERKRWRRKGDNKRNLDEGDCLISRVDDGEAVQDERRLQLGPCSSGEAWTWRINGDGVLVQDERALEFTRRRSQDKAVGGGALGRLILDSIPQLEAGRSVDIREPSTNCVWRVDTTEATSGPCNVTEPVDTAPIEVRAPTDRIGAADKLAPPQQKGGDASKRIVGFSLIRYQATATSTPKLPSLARTKAKPPSDAAAASVPDADDTSHAPSDKREVREAPEGDDVASQQEHNVPSTTRTSQSHASGPAMHPELKPVSELLFTSVSHTGTHPPKKQQGSASFSVNLVGASPLTLGAAASSQRMPQKPVGNQNRHLLHHPPTPSMGLPEQFSHDDAPHKPRKIPVHSYIASSKNGVWVDPDTGLEYLTDLSEYLGHDRKETGRHTLMGVGQYTRTVFKIKVYGCALYVAKRDALADPGFTPFASLTSEELRVNDDFYDHIMTNDPSEASFDRTLFIKTNMQLATEVMRSSLESDWKLLTPEHKNMLISSSLNPREAEEPMLRKIQSEDNPSHCSCGQSAPEEYGADPSCCARGTELVFTWRKNGDLELRLDGRVMDVFTDPELGKGIFFEYVRGDDPMSMEARDRFADGFPFLLAPLAQVKGVSSPVLPHEGATDATKKMRKQKGVGVVRFFGNVVGAVSAQAAAAQDWVLGGAEEIKSHATNTMKAAEQTARNVHSELEKFRTMAWDNLAAVPDGASQFLSRMPFGKERGSVDPVDAQIEPQEYGGKMNKTNRQVVVGPRGRVFRPPSGGVPEETDEIGVIIRPMSFTHRLFLYTVHFYLMLLLIVSVPGSYSTRLVVKRPGGSRSKSISTDDESDEQLYGSLMKMDSRKERASGLRGLEVSLQVRLEKEEKSPQEPELWDEDYGNFGGETSRLSDFDRERSDSQQQSGMTKSLSYYL